MKMSKDDVTNREVLETILEAINVFSSHVDSEFNTVRSEINSTKSEAGSMKSEIKSINTRLTRVESEMVTKDYLDRKLWDLQGDMVAMTRREIARHEERFHAAT